MPLDIQTILVVLLTNVIGTAIALPVLMGWRVSRAARAFQGAAVAQAIGWTAFIVAPHIDDRVFSTLSMASLAASFVLLWTALDTWLGKRPGHGLMLALAVAIPVGYGLGFASYPFRVGWSNAGFALQLGLLCFALAHPAPHASRRWRGLVLLCMMALAVVTLWRGVLGAFFTEAYPFYHATHPVNVAAALLYHVALALSTIGFLVAWREEAERELRVQASTDGLTGLLNRQAFAERAADAIAAAQRYGEPLALLMIDIDHFKRINDTRGHAAGDEALRTVARALRASARRGDLVSRHGGEEFCVLMTHAGSAEATAFDARLRERLAREPAGAPGLSAGATTLRADDSLDRLTHRADQALYRAKAEGRGRLEHAT